MKDYVCAILLLIGLAHSAPQLQEQAETDWPPSTTLDDWIRIESPTTEEFPQSQESTAEPITESTIESLTSAKPMTESTIIHDTTMIDLLSTIATVTINTELPVPIEILNMSDYKQVCGLRFFPQPRIYGGNPSSFGKWPWQISLGLWRFPKSHICDAVLLNENWAITAAHCIKGIPLAELLLRIGVHDLENDDVPYGYQERRVHMVATHLQDISSNNFNVSDLALLRFSQLSLPFQPNVLPICLPDDDETYAGRTAYVTGWGRFYKEERQSSVLQEVAVPVLNNSECEEWYRNANYTKIPQITQTYICTGCMHSGYGPCKGDSGGPMVVQRARDQRWVLAGMVSWEIGSAEPYQPDVYTRISMYREWINQILQL